MEARTFQGSELFRRTLQLTAAVALLCMVHTVPGVLPNANAATFEPTSIDELTNAFAIAGVNGEDDVIDMDGQVFELQAELILEPDEGHSLALRDGTLARSEEAESFRLLRLVGVPAGFEDEELPVIIEGVQFKNGLYDDNNLIVSASGGGALLADRKTLLYNARFMNNRVQGNSSGGAIKHSKLLDISSVLFVNNQAIANEASQLARGGAIAAEPGARLFIAHGYFLGNTADQGGAVYAPYKVTNLNITRSAFDGNQANSFGGAIWLNVGDGDVLDGEVRISNTSFIANQAPKGGGAVYTQSLFADVNMTHLTLWGNESEPGMGGGIRATSPLDGRKLTVRNSVITNNVGGNCTSTKGESLSLSHSAFNLLDDESCGTEGVKILEGVGAVFSGKFDYHSGAIPSLPIAITSPARNMVPRQDCLVFDTRDMMRLDNDVQRDEFCDAGAYEYIPKEFFDRDGDDVVNIDDNCEQMSNPLQSDIDNDGIGDECDGRDDRDSDLDVVLNFQDNCPGVSNFLQLDSDANGIGDACEYKPVRLTLAPVTR